MEKSDCSLGVGDKSKAVKEIFILHGRSGQDASLSYKKSSNFCLPIWEGQVHGGDEKLFLEVCLHYIFRNWREREFTRAKLKFGTPCVSNRWVSGRSNVYGNKCNLWDWLWFESKLLSFYEF